MKNNRIIWGLVALVVLTTLVVSFGTMSSHSQQDNSKKQDKNPFGDLSKYPVVDYDEPEFANDPEREERKIKNKRYDVSLPVFKKPHPETGSVGGSDIEPVSPAIPFAESRLVVIGEILNSRALLANEKKGIYSEYSVKIETILKEDEQRKLKIDKTITVDRAGGVVRYPNGQKVLYLLSWQNLPELNERYLFFLSSDDDKNPNYKILTAYQLKIGYVTALDNHPHFLEFNGMSETDFIKLVLSKK